MRILSTIYETILYAIKRLFFLLEFFLFLRLVLKFSGANPKALVVEIIYQYSDILVSPFDFIFPDIYLREVYLIEIATVSAMIGYVILAFILFRLLRLFSQD